TREEPAALGILQQYVPNQGDVWEYTLDSVGAFFEEVAASDPPAPDGTAPSVNAILDASAGELSPVAAETIGEYLDVAGLLGTRTAQLHAALSSIADDPAFARRSEE